MRISIAVLSSVTIVQSRRGKVFITVQLEWCGIQCKWQRDVRDQCNTMQFHTSPTDDPSNLITPHKDVSYHESYGGILWVS